jgi:hypothetical protein
MRGHLTVPSAEIPRNDLAVQQLGRVSAGDEPSVKPALNRKVEAIPNHTGLPDRLKAGFENLSGLAIGEVRVHLNSLQAFAQSGLGPDRGKPAMPQ